MGADVKGGGAVYLALGIRPQWALLGHTLGKVDGHLGVDQDPAQPEGGTRPGFPQGLLWLAACGRLPGLPQAAGKYPGGGLRAYAR